jgi:hypothetical protein
MTYNLLHLIIKKPKFQGNVLGRSEPIHYVIVKLTGDDMLHQSYHNSSSYDNNGEWVTLKEMMGTHEPKPKKSSYLDVRNTALFQLLLCLSFGMMRSSVHQ